MAITAAQEAVEQEYAACRALEVVFTKKWRKLGKDWRLHSFQESADFSAMLCRAVGTKIIKEVRRLDRSWCGGLYQGRVIYAPQEAPVVTIIHETAHHIHHEEWLGGSPHGKQFCEVEQMLFDFLLTRDRFL